MAILHNFKESDTTDSTTRKHEDIESCCLLFSTYLNISVSVKMPFALERETPDHVVY